MKPYAKAQLVPLAGLRDRRRRLTDAQKREIRELYATGEISQRSLAKLYCVSKSLIGITVNPSRAAATRERVKEHWRDYYLRRGKAAHAAAVRNTRNDKYRLYKAAEKEA